MPIVNDPERHKDPVSAKVPAISRQYVRFWRMVLRGRVRFARVRSKPRRPEGQNHVTNRPRFSGGARRTHDHQPPGIEEFILAATMAVATALTIGEFLVCGRVPTPIRMKQNSGTRRIPSTFAGYPLKWGVNQSRTDLQRLSTRVLGTPHHPCVN